jgi:soluble lytic murein transglycosylase
MNRILAVAVFGVTAVVVIAFASGSDDTFKRWYEKVRYPLHYETIIRGHARNYDLDPALIAAVIYQESRFRPYVRSESGAIGLMQVMPETARGIALRTGGRDFRVADLFDPEINVRYGSWYLRHLIDRYGGDERLALAAYNAGQQRVDAWRRSGVGIRFEETREYVRRVQELEEVYRSAHDFTPTSK